MSKTFIPEGYKSVLGLYDTQSAIGFIKRTFEDKLMAALSLKRVSAPLFVEPSTGLNDNLSGKERAVSFDIKDADTTAEVVHSLAKWKRLALGKYGFYPGRGLYTDMNAIRRDEELDNLHSVYTDQWDWEKVITREDRNIEYLKETVRAEVKAMCETLDEIKKRYPQIDVELCPEVSFVTTQELEDMYPDLTSKERENAYLKEHRTAFIMQIGDLLRSGKKHDGRAPDYDDGKLNGDIMFWDDLLDCAIEISSMGIRVDAKSLDEQLTKTGDNDRRELPFHRAVFNDELPLTMGGGIGQSRFCMLLLGKAHIGEVQVSVWDADTKKRCEEAGVILL
ncbi:MAG: aspartate--ammonia ligase [Clostridia bacterium]|nr:aspartate--ammonia ligase [Clostridia bacterium]